MKYLPTAIVICTFCISFSGFSTPFDQLTDTQASDLKQGNITIEDKKVIAILRDATAFFCQDQPK